ncbi:MAG: hypothetical protein IPH04_13290 [Saprospirales bacterium]|nr:hypothetical protein [Saprospirales bacterium]
MTYYNYFDKSIEESFDWVLQNEISKIKILLVSGDGIYINFFRKDCEYVDSWANNDTITESSLGLFKDNLFTSFTFEYNCEENLESLFQLESKIMEKLSSINQSTLLGKVGDFKQPSPNFRFKYCAPIGTKPKAWVKELFGANIEHDESRKMPYTLGEWEQKSILSSDVHDLKK